MSFDRIAPYYRWMELILAGEKLHRGRTTFLDQISAPKNVLLVGEGHGRSLVEYCRRFPDAQITCLDASEAMLAQAQHHLVKHHLKTTNVKFIHADALNWLSVGTPFDLIVTNFFFDCFRADQLNRLIPKLAAIASADANWLVADFQTVSHGWKRLRSGLILWSMYVFFRVVTRLPAKKLTPPDEFLKNAGFILRHRIEFEWNLLHSDWWIRNR